ncbi:WYL domain-containing protein [Xanthobacter sp. V4C-4]|uniref:WYL domain-containing protein n=1 Tax=Xanthobacter cornucopiae TaxID=3119924 RepID=UPI00372AE812
MNAITSLKSFFIDRVAALGAPLYANAGQIALPADDPHDEIADHAREHDPAEGQSFVIDYVDHAGHVSHRRISVWAIQRNVEGIPILVAKCHERQAARAFRVDRIRAVTDFDGTRREPLSRFFFETFGFTWPRDAIIVPGEDPSEARWDRIRTLINRSGVVLLLALALADGELGAAETEEIRFFCETACGRAGLDLTGAERERLAAYLGRLRPTAESVDAALDVLMEAERPAIADLLKAGLKVIAADGVLKDDEAMMLDSFCITLTGQSLL